ncbi:single-stranded DNA-binding protein [Actinokineospora inagensis]|uniref:single-stranded DNA-binding protein n=1 Tax=Actinokineospora inagensis TaxID=103730 RepID=UPI00040956CB|nr:single-stranded DNA-binding protein [Actinokineospora inagensis]
MNETMITLVGRVVGDVTARRYPEDKQLVRFRMMAKERRYLRENDAWVDGETLFLTVNSWDGLGAAVRGTLHRGDRVIVYGRLRHRDQRSADDDPHRFEALVDARAIGADVLFQDIAITRPNWVTTGSTDHSDPVETAGSTVGSTAATAPLLPFDLPEPLERAA